MSNKEELIRDIVLIAHEKKIIYVTHRIRHLKQGALMSIVAALGIFYLLGPMGILYQEGEMDFLHLIIKYMSYVFLVLSFCYFLLAYLWTKRLNNLKRLKIECQAKKVIGANDE